MMKTRDYTIDGRTLTTHYIETDGVEDILREVFDQDFYRIKQLHDDKVEIRNVVDVGAHMGFFGRLIHHYWPQARVVSIEPDFKLAECLEKNAGLPVLTAVAIRYDGRSEFFVSPKTGGSLIFDPTINFSEDVTHTYERRRVVAAPLEVVDKWLGNEPIDLLKLDCEGSEFDILCNMPPDTRARVKRIVGEYHHLSGYRYVEQIINLRYHHLKPIPRVEDPLVTIGGFAAVPR